MALKTSNKQRSEEKKRAEMQAVLQHQKNLSITKNVFFIALALVVVFTVII